MKKAIELYEDFSGDDAAYYDSYDVPALDVAVKVGTLDGVLYTTVRDGRRESYIHKFKNSARPLLVSSFDGRTLGIVGGQFRFTDRGIVDD